MDSKDVKSQPLRALVTSRGRSRSRSPPPCLRGEIPKERDRSRSRSRSTSRERDEEPICAGASSGSRQCETTCTETDPVAGDRLCRSCIHTTAACSRCRQRHLLSDQRLKLYYPRKGMTVNSEFLCVDGKCLPSDTVDIPDDLFVVGSIVHLTRDRHREATVVASNPVWATVQTLNHEFIEVQTSDITLYRL